MKKFKRPACIVWACVIAIALILGVAANHAGAEPPSAAPTQTNAVPAQASPPEAPPASGKYQITGAELYSIHCNRCHAERYPTERTAAQWKTIMLHMQVRANIPVQQCRLILKYLQDNSGR